MDVPVLQLHKRCNNVVAKVTLEVVELLASRRNIPGTRLPSAEECSGCDSRPFLMRPAHTCVCGVASEHPSQIAGRPLGRLSNSMGSDPPEQINICVRSPGHGLHHTQIEINLLHEARNYKRLELRGSVGHAQSAAGLQGRVPYGEVVLDVGLDASHLGIEGARRAVCPGQPVGDHVVARRQARTPGRYARIWVMPQAAALTPGPVLPRPLCRRHHHRTA